VVCSNLAGPVNARERAPFTERVEGALSLGSRIAALNA
jgi:hypothetical protein